MHWTFLRNRQCSSITKLRLIKKFFHMFAVAGPSWIFFLTVDSKNCIDLNRICLSLEVTLYKPNETDRLDGSENIIFANNTLHSLFSHVELFRNEKLISSSNNNYHHLAFVETELSTDTTSKNTWARFNQSPYR